jgi:uncharacterized protein with ParB-like and HNH nuclease domain
VIFGGVQQYVIPLFQRPYSWESKQWNTLWQDLVELCEDEKPRNHFIGSIVTLPSRSVPEGVSKFILIDGQQRLATLLVLLAAIRDRARTQPGNLANRIDDLLLKNRHQDGTDVYKLLPTQFDRESYCSIMDSKDGSKEGNLAKAYDFFHKKLRLATNVSLERLNDVICKNLVVVSIVLDKDDNPYLIFESLNAKGQRLTQADLIRNFFFMRIHVTAQEKIFQECWLPMQQRLGDDMTEFIRHFLMRKGRLVKQSDIYYTLKESIEDKSEDEVVGVLKEVANFSTYYAKLLDPTGEKSAQISIRMMRLNRFEATTAYPFLLNVYHEYENGALFENDFAAILDLLETFLIRRFVCGVPTHGLNRTFASLFESAAKAESLIGGIKQVLKDRFFPRDQEFAERFITCKLYGDGERRVKAKLILERLESWFGHKEGIDLNSMTIEHLMPQTITDWWRQELGDDWEVTHQTWLDTIGNLTLTGYNPELSNADFLTKKAILQRSHIELNRYFTSVEKWEEKAIDRRGEELAKLALSIWPDFAGPETAPVEVADDEDQKQEESQLLTARVIDQFGGQVERLGSASRQIFRVGDGKTLNIKYSKRHTQYYWFGVHASLWEEVGRLGVTHIVFILVPHGFLSVPVAIVNDYIGEANFSPKSDGSVRHYHLLISLEPKLELFHHGKPGRVPLKQYYSKFVG